MNTNASNNLTWHNRLNKIMPFGSSTCSKAPVYLPEEPAVIIRGKGCRVWDADGHEFIDFRNGLGPITLGYQFSPVDDAIREQLNSGITFGHVHPLECEVAELISEMVPCAQKVRFLKTGGEAVAASIRIARAYTRKNHIIQIGYNGWLNSLAANSMFMPGKSSTGAPAGIPQCLSDLHHTCNWADMATLEQLFEHFKNDIAAVVVAASYENIEKGAQFYPSLRALTQKHNAILIFDEIVTGFRIAKGGVQEYFNTVPDMAIFSKGVANGMPLSVYCGTKEIMDICQTSPVAISSTFGGETLSLAAAKAALIFMQNNDVIGHLWEKGEIMWNGVNQLFKKYNIPMQIKGFWPCCAVTVTNDTKPDLRDKFFRTAYKNGLSLYAVNYVNYSHTDSDIAEALVRIENIIKVL